MTKSPAMTNQILLDQMVSFAVKTFDGKGVMIPMWLLVNEVGDVQPVATPYLEGSEEEKNAISHAIRELATRDGAIRVGYMAETWYLDSKFDPSINKDHAAGIDIVPSERPNRREAIFYMVEDKFGNVTVARQEIVRDGDSATLSELERMPVQHTEGRFANFFPQKTVVH